MFETFRALRDSAAGAMFVRLLVLVALLGGALAALQLWHRNREASGPVVSHSVRAPVLIPVAIPSPPPAPGPGLTLAEQRRWFRPLELARMTFTFQPRQGIAPGEICARLKELGWKTDRAGAAPRSGREECAMERTYPRPGDGPPTRLFAMARSARDDDDNALDVRVKANLHDEAKAADAGRDVAVVLADLLSRVGRAPGEALLAKVAAFETFEAEVAGAKLSLKPERADIRRFNLSVLLPRPFEAGDSSRFAPIPPEEKRLIGRQGLVPQGLSADAGPADRP